MDRAHVDGFLFRSQDCSWSSQGASHDMEKEHEGVVVTKGCCVVLWGLGLGFRA